MAENGYERVFINVGKGDGFFAPDLIRMINQNTHGPQVGLGRIDLLGSYSLFDVRLGDAHRVISALKNLDYFGKRLYLEMAQEGKDYAGTGGNAPLKRNRAERRRAEREAWSDDLEFEPRRRGRSGKPRPHNRKGKAEELPFAMFRKKDGKKKDKKRK